MKLSALAAQIKNCGHCEVINNGGRIFVGTGSAFYCMDGYPRTQDAGELGAMLGIPQKKMKNIFYHEEYTISKTKCKTGDKEMRKIFMAGVSAAASVLLLASCNKQMIDLTYEYSQAQIKMPDGTVIEGKVDSWNDYEGDQLQVKINGTTYLVHSSNVILWH